MILTQNLIINEKNIKYIKPETRNEIVNGINQSFSGILIGYIDGETVFHTGADFQAVINDCISLRNISIIQKTINLSGAAEQPQKDTAPNKQETTPIKQVQF